ncbi:hypothetical protein ISN44_As09g009970 [Arabidopsis suecica]|uniref:Uncharacterized protein n=1 Tax=Arabidopsis suecica TaxID=45249 RepID=A0A8T2AGJ1_ARASU|nr:hypothetical protein ISN44_As09g009970 [Arabidopsis suecica]
MDIKKPFPGMWRFPINPEICCIYRVPECLRSVNPEAYTPQVVLIGPLNQSIKYQAYRSLGDITNTKSTGYVNMEECKKIYLADFTRRVVGGKNTINGFIRMIKEDEERIRDSYSESTAWIESQEFVEMILHDCVFILELILRTFEIRREKRGDPIIDKPCLRVTIKGDLMLLENQLPYFILEKLFKPIFPRIQELIIEYFKFEGKIGNESKFRHFTDLFRCVRVETLQELPPMEFNQIEHMYNAVKLHSGGVKFEAVENEYSLYVRFENGCLKMPSLAVDDQEETKLRNIMALEQCHYPYDPHVCNYITFLDYLIDTEKDVDLLVEKGIIRNWIGQHSLVAEMVNKLTSNIIDYGSYCSHISVQVNAYYSSPFNRSYAVLKRVYFGNMWIGTATVAAMLLLLMTLVQTVASIIQVKQK